MAIESARVRRNRWLVGVLAATLAGWTLGPSEAEELVNNAVSWTSDKKMPNEVLLEWSGAPPENDPPLLTVEDDVEVQLEHRVSVTTEVIRIADLAITKTDGSSTEVPGTPVTYTIVASNPVGPSNAPGTKITDDFPAILSSCDWTCAADGGATCAAATGSGDIDVTVDLPVGSSMTFEATCDIDPSATGTLENTAVVTPGDGVSDGEDAATAPGVVARTVSINNTATDVDTLMPSADVSISKSASPPSVGTGELVVYTIVATNNGPSSAMDVEISDPLPASFVFVSASPSPFTLCEVPTLESNGTVTCEWAGSTLPGDARSLEITARFVGELGPPIVNTATVSTPTDDPEGGNDSAAATVIGTPGVPEIPTLGNTALILLALGLGIAAVRRLRS